MTREGALVIMIAVALVLLAIGVWAWLRRMRRDGELTAPIGEVPARAAVRSVFPGLYVATTRHGEPLERLAIRGLGFRSRVDLTITDAGLALDLTGQPRIFLPTDRIAGAGQSTVVIDRVVEPGGLVRVEWRTGDGTVVDSYFRPQDASARALADAIAELLAPTPTGPDA